MADTLTSAPPKGWARFWIWLRAVDEALDRTPLDFVEARVGRLEQRLAALEAGRPGSDAAADAD